MQFKKIIKYLKIYWLYTIYSIKISLQERLSAVIFTIGKLARFSIFFIFIYFLTQKTNTLSGYTNNQVIIFYLTYSLVESFTQLLFREVYRFLPLIISGDFDTLLVKPAHPFLKVLLGGFDVLDMIPITTYIILLFYFVTANIQSIFIYILLIVMAILISLAFHILILACAILISDLDHMVMIFRDLSRLASLPIEIYGPTLKTISYVLLIVFMYNFPAKAIMGILDLNNIILMFLIAVLSVFVAIKIWDFALLKYQSASS